MLIIGVQHLGRIQGELATGGLGGEEEHLVQLLGRQGLEQREDRADGFTNARGGLGHQAAAGADGLVHRLGKDALAGTEIGMREGQGLCGTVTRFAVLHLPLGPAEE